ncbi:MAG TPA: glutamine synthetase family protein [Polyangiales bacterium]|nr:glutamine synthetase family protein [Polyangiales bacterium]
MQEIERSGAPKVKVAITDLDGVLRGKYLHRDKFLSASKSGFGFCNVVFGWDAADVCYDNARYTGWHTGYPDALARIDPSTFRRVPWDGNVPFFLGDFEDASGKPLAVCPRQTLKKVIARADKLGMKALFGMEFEWFNFRETAETLAQKDYANPQPLTPGMFGYSIVRASQNAPFFNALMDELRAFNVPIEGLHTETGPGVFEAAILYSDALEAADRATLFKTGTKEIASRFGITPSFMAKWNSKLPGCSGHCHQSLWTADGKKNLFDDEKAEHRMSKVFKSYIAGQLTLMPELLPFFAPTVNSYKRLVDGYWAPTKPTWGVDNRTVALRVIPGSAKSTRLETRVVGSDVNPYLAIAACFAAGLWGVEQKLKLKDAPVLTSGYTAEAERLPRSLDEATDRLAASKIAPEILGKEFVEHFVASRRWEWRQFLDAVTDFELKRYFEVI